MIFTECGAYTKQNTRSFNFIIMATLSAKYYYCQRRSWQQQHSLMENLPNFKPQKSHKLTAPYSVDLKFTFPNEDNILSSCHVKWKAIVLVSLLSLKHYDNK